MYRPFLQMKYEWFVAVKRGAIFTNAILRSVLLCEIQLGVGRSSSVCRAVRIGAGVHVGYAMPFAALMIP